MDQNTVVNIQSFLIVVLVGAIIYLIRTSTTSYINNIFSKQIEAFKAELQKISIQTQATFDYKQFITQESYKATLKAYSSIFDAYDSYWESLSVVGKSGETDTGYKELKEFKKKLTQSLVLLDEEIYAKINTLIGNMMEISEYRHSGQHPNIDTVKEMNKLFSEIPNLIRTKFGLENIPEGILKIDATPDNLDDSNSKN